MKPGHRNAGRWIWLAVVLVKPINAVFFKRRWRGREHIPPTGGVVLVANHVSQADWMHRSAGVHLGLRADAPLPGQGQPVPGPRGAAACCAAPSQIPVSRGTAAAAQRAARRRTPRSAGGEVVCIYPEGTVTRDPGFWPMQARTGVARLALATDVPVVPVGAAGARSTLLDVYRKRSARCRGTRSGASAGPPVDLSAYRGAAADRGRCCAR